MSAFIVGNEHITAMLSGIRFGSTGDRSYYWNNERHPIVLHEQEVGQKLTDENYRSVNYRYVENANPPRYKHQPTFREFSQVEIIKLCDCYSYQTCETSDWPETEAHAICNAIREMAIHSLPGYDDAPWGF